MIITGKHLQELGEQIITLAEPHIGPASIDVRLGSEFKVGTEDSYINVNANGDVVYHGFETIYFKAGDPIMFQRGKFYIAHSVEYVSLPPNVGALLFLRSSAGRRGLDHLHAGYLEPGWHGQITFELQPAIDTMFIVGSRVAQMVLFTTTDDASYDGSYNGQRGSTLAARDAIEEVLVNG